MPWKECHVMDERPPFVARLLDGEKMGAGVRRIRISQKTGFKIFDWDDCGGGVFRAPDRHLPEVAVLSCFVHDPLSL
jgi:hypothetical protein